MTFPGTTLLDLPNVPITQAEFPLHSVYTHVVLNKTSYKATLAQVLGRVPTVITTDTIFNGRSWAQTILCDCSNNDIDVTLPPATGTQRDYVLEKIDKSLNGFRPLAQGTDYLEDPTGQTHLNRHFDTQYERIVFRDVSAGHWKIVEYYAPIMPTFNSKGGTGYGTTEGQSTSLVSTPDNLTLDMTAGRGEWVIRKEIGRAAWFARSWEPVTGFVPNPDGVFAVGFELQNPGEASEAVVPVWGSEVVSTFTPLEAERIVQVGAIPTQGGVITAATTGTYTVENTLGYLRNLENDVGVFNSANDPMLVGFPGGLNLSSLAGNAHSAFGGFNIDWRTPSVIRHATTIPIFPFVALAFPSTGTFFFSPTAEIDPGSYEDLGNPGVTTALVGGQVTKQEFVTFPSIRVVGAYFGNVVYSNMAAALANYLQEPFVESGLTATALKTQTVLILRTVLDVPASILLGDVVIFNRQRFF